MKFARESRYIIVRAYGIKALEGWSEAHEAELRRGHALRVRLAEIAGEADRRYAEAVAQHPELMPAYAACAAALQHYEALLARRTEQRRETRRRAIAPALTAEIAAAKAGLGDAIKARKAALIAAKATGWDRVTAILAKAHDDAVAAACYDSGVYYDTANAIRQSYLTARQRMLADRAAGQPATMRVPAYDGGRIVNQIKAGGIPLGHFLSGRARPATMLDDRVTLVMASQIDGPVKEITRERNGKVETVRWRPPGEQVPLTVRINRHRDLPDLPEARVKKVELILRQHRDWARVPETVRRRPDKRWSARDSHVVITIAAPAGTLVAAAPAGVAPVAVNLGWRLMEDGALRVATVRAARGPADLALGGVKLALLPDTPAGQVEVSAALLARRQCRDDAGIVGVEAIETARREHYQVMLPRLGAIARTPGLPAALAAEIAALGDLAEPSPGIGARLAAFVTLWERSASEWLPDDLAAFVAWRRADNRWRTIAAAARRRFEGARRDAFRRAAKKIAEYASVILIDDIDLAALRRRPRDADPVLERAQRLNNILAAPGELRAAIINAARRYGRPVVTAADHSAYRWCPVGDHPIAPALPGDRRYLCDRCNVWLDRDEAYCLTRLRRYWDEERSVTPLAAE